MSDEQESFPLLFLIDAADGDAYANADLWPTSGANKPSNPEKFILAMTYGFKMHVPKQIEKPDNSFARGEYFKDDDRALIYSIAVASEGNLDIVLDGKKVAHIAEAYAHGGITLLAQRLSEVPQGTLWDDLENEILSPKPGPTKQEATTA